MKHNFIFLFVFLKDEHPGVPETAVISYPHDIKGEGKQMKCFEDIIQILNFMFNDCFL